jgi:hypothetical protein
MRHSILFLLFLFLLHTSSAVAPVLVRFKFIPGTSYNFESTKSRISGNVVNDKIKTRTTYVLTIDSTDTRGVHASWKIGPTTLTGIDPASKNYKALNEKYNAFKGYTLKIILNNNGEMTGLANYNETVSHVKSVLGKIMTPGKKMTPDLQQDLIKEAGSTLFTESALVEHYFPEVKLYFGSYGTSWEDGLFWVYGRTNTIRYDIPLRSKVAIDQEEGQFLISANKKFDAEVMKEALTAFSNEILEGIEQWAVQPERLDNVTYDEHAHYKINPATSLIEGIKLKSQQVANEIKVQESIELTLVPEKSK